LEEKLQETYNKLY